jgi:hypothetical protein
MKHAFRILRPCGAAKGTSQLGGVHLSGGGGSCRARVTAVSWQVRGVKFPQGPAMSDRRVTVKHETGADGKEKVIWVKFTLPSGENIEL